MAVEVACQSYEFADEQESFDYLTEMGMEGYNPKVKIDTRENSSSSTSNPTGIYHNYTHDVESIWWVLVWTVFVYEKAPVLTDETSTKFAEAQRSSYFSLFPADLNFGRRYTFLVDRGLFKRHMKNVPMDCRGAAATRRADAIDRSRISGGDSVCSRWTRSTAQCILVG